MIPDPAPEPSPARVGVFGGTFDPPHLGHIGVARDVADALGLHRVVWMPAGHSPHKERFAAAPAEHRLDMVRAAIGADDRFEVSRVELDRPGPSYTVDTLRELREQLGDVELYLIIGVDQFRAFDSWREPDSILRLARLAVMDRSGDPAREVTSQSVARALAGVDSAAHDAPAVFVPVTRIDISSTAVRTRVRAGGDPSEMVPPAVGEIIEARALYRVGDSEATGVDEDALTRWGRTIGASVDTPVVIGLSGPLGAGKSVLARAIGIGAGVEEAMPSPTYNLLLRYVTRRASVVHVDLYRLSTPDEVWELGWSEIGARGEIVLIEWPERAGPFMPTDHWMVDLSVSEGDTLRRDMTVRAVGAPPPLPPLTASVSVPGS